MSHEQTRKAERDAYLRGRRDAIYEAAQLLRGPYPELSRLTRGEDFASIRERCAASIERHEAEVNAKRREAEAASEVTVEPDYVTVCPTCKTEFVGTDAPHHLFEEQNGKRAMGLLFDEDHHE